MVFSLAAAATFSSWLTAPVLAEAADGHAAVVAGFGGRLCGAFSDAVAPGATGFGGNGLDAAGLTVAAGLGAAGFGGAGAALAAGTPVGAVGTAKLPVAVPGFVGSLLRNRPSATRNVPFACSMFMGLVRTRFAPIRKALATPA